MSTLELPHQLHALALAHLEKLQSYHLVHVPDAARALLLKSTHSRVPGGTSVADRDKGQTCLQLMTLSVSAS